MYSHDDYFQTYRKPFLFLQKLDIGKPKASYMMRMAQAIHVLFAGDDCPHMLELTLCGAFSLFFGLFFSLFSFSRAGKSKFSNLPLLSEKCTISKSNHQN